MTRKRAKSCGCAFGETPEYGMQHRPPGAEEGAPLYDLTGNGVYPADVYDHPEWYASGHPLDMDAWALAARKRGRPESPVWIYRAAPCEVKTINSGDWVTTVFRYAREHGKHDSDPSQDLCVGVAKTWARCIHTDGNSLFEWGYNCPEPLRMTRRFRPRKRR